MAALRMVSEEDRTDLRIEGDYVVTCQFCNRSETFDDTDLDKSDDDNAAPAA